MHPTRTLVVLSSHHAGSICKNSTEGKSLGQSDRCQVSPLQVLSDSGQIDEQAPVGKGIGLHFALLDKRFMQSSARRTTTIQRSRACTQKPVISWFEAGSQRPTSHCSCSFSS